MKTTKKKLHLFLEMSSFEPKRILKDLKLKKIKDSTTSNKLLAIACSKLLELQDKIKQHEDPTGPILVVDEEESRTSH